MSDVDLWTLFEKQGIIIRPSSDESEGWFFTIRDIFEPYGPFPTKQEALRSALSLLVDETSRRYEWRKLHQPGTPAYNTLTPRERFVEDALIRYANEEISIGRLAEILGVPHAEAQHIAGSHGLVVHYGVKDLLDDTVTERRMRQRGEQ